MSSVEAERRGRNEAGRTADGRWPRLRDDPSTNVAMYIIGLVAASTFLRVVIGLTVQAPTVFSDEIGYMKLAESIGRDGRLALFNDPGISYSPLYAVVLAPLHAIGMSPPTAYTTAKILNAFLISLSIVPIYGIARFVLSRPLSLLGAGLAALAPAMLYSSFTMSESVGYPVCLAAIWTILYAIQAPSAKTDLLALVAIGAATTTRIQLIVLLPAGVTAIALVPLLRSPNGGSRWRSLLGTARAHRLLLAVVGLGVAVVAAGAAVGDASSALGRYSIVATHGLPDLGLFLRQLARHAAELEFATGVAPFVATLAVAYLFFARSSRRGPAVAVAAVALSTVAWLLVEVAYDAALFDAPAGGDAPRIHERFLVYVVPFFLVGLLVAYDRARAESLQPLYLASAGVATVLPLFIPFDVVVNQTIAFESYGLHPFARVTDGRLQAVPHATLVAMLVAGVLGFLYAVVRERLRTVVLLVLVAFVMIVTLGWTRIVSSSKFTRSLLPAHQDWVDRAAPTGDVVLISGGGAGGPELQTAYFNSKVGRLYYVCTYHFGPEFGERGVTADRTGTLRDESGDGLRAAYVVAPQRLGLRGRVVGRNPNGRQVLVAPAGGLVSVPPGDSLRAKARCGGDR